MLTDWHCENGCVTQSSLQMPHNPLKESDNIYHRTTENPYIYIKAQNPQIVTEPQSRSTATKNRHVDKLTRTENSQIKPHTYNYLTFDKVIKDTLETRQPLQQMMLQKLDIQI